MSLNFINALKIRVSSIARKTLVKYYRFLGVKIGQNVFISYKAKIDTTYRNYITIGDGCYITYGAIILSHDHSSYWVTPFSEDSGRGKVVLGENVFVGVGAIITRNVTIGENAIIAAGSVVTKDIPENVIVAGNPAKVIKTYSRINR